MVYPYITHTHRIDRLAVFVSSYHGAGAGLTLKGGEVFGRPFIINFFKSDIVYVNIVRIFVIVRQRVQGFRLCREDVIRSSGRVGLDIIPANMNMDAAAVDLMLDQEANQIVRLKDVLDQVEEQYDYCLIDCPPGVGINVLNALAAADDVIIPIKADKNALDGMEELTEVIEEIRPYNPGLSLVKCLVTMFTNDISVVKGEEALRKSEYSTFNTHIRYSKKVVDWTYEKRKSLIETTPRSAATRDYKSLAAEYIRLTRKEG